MAIRFVCPQCGRAGRLPDGFPGGKIRCPECKTISKVDSPIAGSKLTTEATPAEQAEPSAFRQPMPGGDTYEVEDGRAPAGDRDTAANTGRATHPKGSEEAEPKERETAPAGRSH